jgi:solute carrier family 25 S-adenosylmethionine transporter 26
MEDVPDMAVKFAVYETLRITHRGLRDREPNTLEDLFMGGAAGAAAAAATTPLDVIKTRMMCSASSRPTLGGAVRSVLAEGEGARGFFRGVGPRALSNGLNSAVFFCFFEAIRRVLIQHHAEAAAASPQGRAAEQQQQQQQQQQGARQHRQQQPVLALSAAGASSASSIHVGGSSSSGSRRGTQQQQAPAGASSSGGGSGRLACLSLALPIAEWR